MRKIILVRIQLPVYQILIRRLRCASLALVFVCSVFTSIKIYAADVPLGKGLQNFSTNTISSPTFSDVSASDWFHPYVQSVASYGLMIGDNNAAFNPFAQITIAEAITIAARLHSIYHTGEEAFRQGEIWYKTYWEYAKNAEITNLDISVCEQQATRAEFAQIISRAFPPNARPAINTLSDSDYMAETVIITEGVKEIEADAFCNEKNIKSISSNSTDVNYTVDDGILNFNAKAKQVYTIKG